MEYTPTTSHNRSKTIILLVAMILVAGILTLALLRDRIVNQPQWQVSVTGQGKVTYQPDTAKINLGVQIDKAQTADQALTQLNEKINKIYEAIKNSDVAETDINTQNYSLYPQYDYPEGSSTVSGYNANQTLVVTVKDVNSNRDQVAKIVDAATKAGANQIQGVTFEISNLNELKQQARLLAITDAKSKSDEIAATAGVKLGKIVGWWENTIYSPELAAQGYYGNYGGVGGGGASLPQGNQEMIIEVNINYQVK